MMKKIFLSLLMVMFSLVLTAGDLILIKNTSSKPLKELLLNKDLSIHYADDGIVIATASGNFSNYDILLEKDAWADEGRSFFLVRVNSHNRDAYIEEISNISDILYEDRDFMVIAVGEDLVRNLYPAIHGGLINISRQTVIPAGNSFSYNRGSLNPRSDIWTMISLVDTSLLRQEVQHLQDYGTRNAYSAEAVLAQDYIYDYYVNLGLSVELHDFYMPGGDASDNVIATLTGTLYPDEYVVLGGHYDSYSYSGNAPGADDNATGTTGVMEAARIMSQYEFDRSIIFCAWGGEEYGLYGSAAWASQAAADDMDILGYFNMDMAGYLAPGEEIHTDVIAPSSAQELVDFYMEVCGIYLPDFPVSIGSLTGGDSDHTSFNNNGYMGIFPFEDAQNYSPYIHTSDDVIGLSVNNFEQHGIFTQAIIANVATMADDQLPTPTLSAIPGDQVVNLYWNTLDDADSYNIYKDENSIPWMNLTDTMYMDTDVINGETYSYFVTAVYSGGNDESGPSNRVTVTPLQPLALPFLDDFESNAPYWNFEGTWGLQEGTYYSPSHSMTESPGANYGPSMNTSATLYPFNLEGVIHADLSFFSQYNIESGWDFMYLEISVDGSAWETLDSFTGQMPFWEEYTYALDDYIGEPYIVVRFRFFSDNNTQAAGMMIDDFELSIDYVGLEEKPAAGAFRLAQNTPNPCHDHTSISFTLPEDGDVRLDLYDAGGRKVASLIDSWYARGSHYHSFSVAALNEGVYYYILQADNSSATRKMVIVR